jgi:hypothetical protein
MKMIAECIEHAVQFELLARFEENPKLKADFEDQAAVYRKLATERAKKLGLPPPGWRIVLPRAGIFQGWGGTDGLTPQVTRRASELERPQRIAPALGPFLLALAARN